MINDLFAPSALYKKERKFCKQSLASMSWNSATLHENGLTLNLCFTESIKRIDIRYKNAGKFTKYGVSLTPSELNHCVEYAENFRKPPLVSVYYNLTIAKDGKSTFRITKGRGNVITSLGFWEEIKALIPAAKYLCGSDIEIERLLELYTLCKTRSKEKDLSGCWSCVVFQVEPETCFLYKLGLVDKVQFVGKFIIDLKKLEEFKENNPVVFNSFVEVCHTI